jgi:spermidine/putrescine-binding protein
MIHKYGRILNKVSSVQAAEIVRVLKEQKKWIECYTNNLRYFLISEVCPAIAIPAAYMIQTCLDYDWADFVIPASGTVMFVGNLGISAQSKKVGHAHAVIEYLISRRGSATCYKNHLFFPANKLACEELPKNVQSHEYLFPVGPNAPLLYTLHNAISLKKLQRMWHRVIV